MRRLAILGSTGSIGRQAAEVALAHPETLEVVALAARRSVDELVAQARALRPRIAAIADPEIAQRSAGALSELKGLGVEVLLGEQALVQLAGHEEVDLVLNALVGGAGLGVTVAALEAGKTLALANKESLVMGGEVVRRLVGRPAQLLPVDSEHSAIYQCLQGERAAAVRRLILTGSGGPFRGRSISELARVTPEEALSHPTWTMGRKITVDSATLMNKGLEVIEAHFLFDLPYEQLEVVIHPESIIHSLVEFHDFSMKAQLGYPDMRLPIQYALTYPERLPAAGRPLDLAKVKELHFMEPDMETFRCLRYALDAGRQGRTFPAVLSAANEVAVEAFLDERIDFIAIPQVVEETLAAHTPASVMDLEAVRESDRWAREYASRLIEEGVTWD